jgi:hypothetical protein
MDKRPLAKVDLPADLEERGRVAALAALAAHSALVVLEPTAARTYCEALAGGLAAQRIDRDRAPYLVRYFLAGWSPSNRRPGPAVFLHHFLASDAYNGLHSHPWAWSASLILVGGYREHRCTGPRGTVVREFRPGDVNVLTATDRHRIELLEADAWTLFLAGSFQQEWQFATDCGEFAW